MQQALPTAVLQHREIGHYPSQPFAARGSGVSFAGKAAAMDLGVIVDSVD